MSETAPTPNEYATFEAFREQAAEYFGPFEGMDIAGFYIAHPQNLDPDQQERYDALRIYVEESPELGRYADGTVKEPLRTADGKPTESYASRLAKAWLGPDYYDEFKAAGGRDIDVHRAVMRMNLEYAKRKAADPKSGDGDRSSS